jgi:hypothetical protein
MKKFNVGIIVYDWVESVFAADRSAELGRLVKLAELEA